VRRAALLPLLLLLAGCGGSSSASKPTTAEMAPSVFKGAELQSPSAPPDFALRDQDGKLVRLSALRGRPVLVTFLYTHCPDVCPLIAEHLNAALRNNAAATVVAISVDPKRDTRAAVRSYVRSHRLVPRFRYLTGTRAQLTPVWKAYHVIVQPAKLETVDHSTYTLLVDAKGKGRVIYDSQVKASDVVSDLERLRQAP
jgi:protein SCO1/2